MINCKSKRAPIIPNLKVKAIPITKEEKEVEAKALAYLLKHKSRDPNFKPSLVR